MASRYEELQLLQLVMFLECYFVISHYSTIMHQCSMAALSVHNSVTGIPLQGVMGVRYVQISPLQVSMYGDYLQLRKVQTGPRISSR